MLSSILLFQVIVEYAREECKDVKTSKPEERPVKAFVAEKSRSSTIGCRSSGVH